LALHRWQIAIVTAIVVVFAIVSDSSGSC